MSRPRSRTSTPAAPRKARPRALRDWWTANRAIHLFILKFVGVLATLHALTLLPLYDWLLPYYLHLVAALANVLTHGLGEGTAVAEATLRSPAYAVTVSPACSAVELACFIGAAVIAFPSPWRAKASGFFLGVMLIVVLNVVRVTTLFLVGVHARTAFNLVHEDLWSVALILVSTLFVAGWIGRVVKRESPSAEPAPTHDGALG